MNSSDTPLWRETPLIRSQILSSRLGCEVYLKLENLQISGSFKGRGICNFALQAKRDHGDKTHLIIASSGNAAMAASTAARELGLKCTVYLPVSSLSMRAPLVREGAEVVVVGENYDQAQEAATQAVRGLPNAILVPSYNHELVWQGNATLVHEIRSQLPPGKKPGAMLCSVGGGGLLGGVLTGSKAVGWDDVPVFTFETHGSNCFYHAVMSNLHADLVPTYPNGTEVLRDNETGVYFVRLPGITSKASSLGARSPAPGIVKMALERGSVTNVSVGDEMAMDAALGFAADHQMLLELACATTLTPAYSQRLFEQLMGPQKDPERVVVFILCGGTKVALADMYDYRHILDSGISSAHSELWVDGRVVPEV